MDPEATAKAKEREKEEKRHALGSEGPSRFRCKKHAFLQKTVKAKCIFGGEKFAEFIYDKVNPFIVEETQNRVKVAKVEFMEHGKNAAAYLPG